MAAVEGGGEDIMRQMMGEFGKMGEKEVRGSTPKHGTYIHTYIPWVLVF